MRVPSFVYKHMNQDLVYWRQSGNDGEGGFEYDTPVELKCRYEEKVEQVITSTAEDVVSRARLFTPVRLEEGGYVYIGKLSDPAVGNNQSPEDTKKSMRVLASDVIPTLDGRAALFVAYANMGSYNR